MDEGKCMKTYGRYAIGHDNVPCKSIGKISRAIGPLVLGQFFHVHFYIED